MRITQVRELAVKLEGGVANAVVNFSEHTVSLVAVITDVIRGGRPVIGIGFNSIGRFAQSGIIRDRMIPRLLAAPPSSVFIRRAIGSTPPRCWTPSCATKSPAATATAPAPRRSSMRFGT